MATKNKQTPEKKAATAETWRKPLQVPPRTDAMRSFYQGAAENSDQTVEQTNQADADIEKVTEPIETELVSSPQSPPKEAEIKILEATQSAALPTETADSEIDSEPTGSETNKLPPEALSQKLGIEIDDLFDVHELLRGKSFEIYQSLLESADEKGRCKITQPELMKRTGIKNRRTFYKHEDWLIGLKLLEKRHLPGDHKGVVYRVLQMSEVLPIGDEMLRKFQNRLINIE